MGVRDLNTRWVDGSMDDTLATWGHKRGCFDTKPRCSAEAGVCPLQCFYEATIEGKKELVVLCLPFSNYPPPYLSTF